MHAVEDNNVSKVKVYFGHRTCYTVAAAGGGISSNDLTDSMLCDVYIHSLMFVLNDAILRTMIKKKVPALIDHQHLLIQLSERTLIVYLMTRLLLILKCWNCSVRFLKLK